MNTFNNFPKKSIIPDKFVQPNANAEIWPFGVPEEERKYEPVKYLDWYNTNIRKHFPEYSKRNKN
mgnify:CR=1 FL=1